MSDEKIDDLKRELASLKENRDNTNLETRKWIEKRNAAVDQIKSLRVEIKSLREKRDALNKEVQTLKVLREEAKKKRAEKQKEISTQIEKIKPLIRNRPHGDIGEVQKEIEEIDWQIQTTFIPPNEEKYLIDQVKVLETQLSTYKQLQKMGQLIAELKSERNSLEEEARLHHEKLSELANQSQKLHEELIDTAKKIRSLQDEANDAHQKHLEAKQRAQGIHQKYVESLNQVKSLEQGIRQSEKENKAKTELDVREKLKKRSLEKLKQGEKLTWEEFQVLAEDGML